MSQIFHYLDKNSWSQSIACSENCINQTIFKSFQRKTLYKWDFGNKAKILSSTWLPNETILKGSKFLNRIGLLWIGAALMISGTTCAAKGVASFINHRSAKELTAKVFALINNF